MTSSLPLHNLVRITADAAIKAAPGRVWRIDLYATTDAASVLLYNAASATGTEIYGLVAPFTDSDASAAQSTSVSFEDVGGIDFSSKIWADITGTNAVCYIWYD